MNDTEKLQELHDKLNRDEWDQFVIEERASGFWAVPMEARHFHDDGEYLGKTLAEASYALRVMMGDE